MTTPRCSCIVFRVSPLTAVAQVSCQSWWIFAVLNDDRARCITAVEPYGVTGEEAW
jgi:hypothetical protein